MPSGLSFSDSWRWDELPRGHDVKDTAAQWRPLRVRPCRPEIPSGPRLLGDTSHSFEVLDRLLEHRNRYYRPRDARSHLFRST